MKIFMAILRILPSVGAIVFAVLSMNAQDDARTALLGACVACLSLSTILNMRARRQEQEKAPEQQEVQVEAEDDAGEQGEG